MFVSTKPAPCARQNATLSSTPEGSSARQLLPCHRPADFPLERRIKRRAAPDPRRKACRACDERAAETLHVKRRRNMMRTLRHDSVLTQLLNLHRLLQRAALPLRQRGNLPDSIAHELPESLPLRLPHLRADTPDPSHLRDLLIQRQLLKKRLCPLLRRQRRIQICLTHPVSSHSSVLQKILNRPPDLILPATPAEP